MLHVTRRWPGKALTLGLALIALTGIGLAAYARVFSDEEPAGGVLDGVSADELRDGGITLSEPPEGFSPRITQAQAEGAAVEAAKMIDAPVEEVVLSHLRYDIAEPEIDEPMWIVSFDVEGMLAPLFGPPGSPPTAPMKYLLVFVDPNTGDAIRMVRAAEPGFWVGEGAGETEAAGP